MDFLTKTPLLFTSLALVVAGVFGAMNLVVLWALYSGRHWFLRATAVLLTFLILLPTKAYEVVYFFSWYVGILSTIIVASRFIARYRRWKASPKPRERLLPQIRLLDLLLGTLLCGAVVATAMYAAPRIWQTARVRTNWFHIEFYLATAAFAAAIVALHCWALLRDGPSLRRLVLFFSLYGVLAFVAVGWSGSVDWLHLDTVYSNYILMKGADDSFNLVLGLVLWLLFTLWFVAAASLRRPPSAGRNKSAAARIWRSFVRVCGLTAVVAALVPSIWVYSQLVIPPSFLAQKLPNPNGLDALVEAGEKLKPDPPVLASNVPDPPSRLFLDYVRKNQIAIAEAHAALDLPCRIPLDSETEERSRSAFYAIFAAFEAEAVVARDENRPEDAAQIGIDIIRLAQRASSGGAWQELAAGISIERRSERWTRDYRRRLSCDAMIDAIRQIEQVERQRESHATVWRLGAGSKSTRAAFEKQFSWRGLVCLDLERIVPDNSPRYQLSRFYCMRRDTALRLLLVDLAIRAYRHGHGRFPSRLEQLVPEYLERIPDDPFGSGPFGYKSREEDFNLYSVGPNGVDDLGHFDPIVDLYDLPASGDFYLDQKSIW